MTTIEFANIEYATVALPRGGGTRRVSEITLIIRDEQGNAYNQKVQLHRSVRLNPQMFPTPQPKPRERLYKFPWMRVSNGHVAELGGVGEEVKLANGTYRIDIVRAPVTTHTPNMVETAMMDVPQPVSLAESIRKIGYPDYDLNNEEEWERQSQAARDRQLGPDAPHAWGVDRGRVYELPPMPEDPTPKLLKKLLKEIKKVVRNTNLDPTDMTNPRNWEHPFGGEEEKK